MTNSDGLASQLVIRAYEYLNFSPGFVLAAHGWAESIGAGLTPPYLTMGYENKTIVAGIGNKIAGVIVWDALPHRHEAFIVFGYVETAYRRQGVYTALYGKLKELARDAGLQRISGATSTSNHEMMETAERLGRRAVAIIYEEEL